VGLEGRKVDGVGREDHLEDPDHGDHRDLVLTVLEGLMETLMVQGGLGDRRADHPEGLGDHREDQVEYWEDHLGEILMNRSKAGIRDLLSQVEIREQTLAST